jgi:hypothetical protein
MNMKGSNVMELNQETMCEAMQVWLEKTLKEGHGCTVTKVEAGEARSSYSASGFKVTVGVAEKAAT